MSASDHYCRSVLQRLQAQLEDEPYEDVEVEVRGQTFFCHRFLLSACSVFFRALFRSGMSETLQKMVQLKDMEPDTFQLILDCIYGGKNVITRENVLVIWRAANLLQIDFLQEACVIFLMGRTNKENCIDVYINAKHLSSDRVSSLAWDWILKEFEYLVGSKDIFLLDIYDMEHLVGSNDLRLQSEDIVIDVVKEWVKLYQPATKGEAENAENDIESSPDKNLPTKAPGKGKRAKNAAMKNAGLGRARAGLPVTGAHRGQENILATLLGASRLCLASASCLQELMEDPSVIQNTAALWHVRNALHFHLHPERRGDFCPTAAVHRSGDNLANVLVSITAPSSNNRQPSLVVKREPQHDWDTLVTGTCTYSQCNSVVYGNSIFGTACDVPKNTTFMFHFSLQRNNTMAFAMIGQQGLKNRVNHATVCHENYLYMVGGDNGELSIDRFDLDGLPNGQWETVGELLQPVASPVATVLGGLVIVIGNVRSEGEDEVASLIQCFDPKTNSTRLVVDTVPRAAEKRVFVKHWSEVYLLQEGGDFWRLRTTGEKDRLHLDYRGRLWNSRVDLTSSIVYREELIVLAPPLPAPAPTDGEDQEEEEEKVPAQWETPENELFKHVQILREDKCCLMNAVLPSALIPKKR